MEFLENFTEEKLLDCAKMIKIMTSSYRHIVTVTKRINENFHKRNIFSNIVIW